MTRGFSNAASEVSVAGRLAMLLILSLFHPNASSAADGRQAVFDADGARLAKGLGQLPARGRRDELVDTEPAGVAWRPVTDGQMREACGGCAPRGYSFHRSAQVDIDHDARADLVEMVTNGREYALRVTYGASRRSARLIMRSAERAWSDQGIFAAGTHAVLVNQPEVNAFVVRQRAGRIFVSFIGD